MAYPYPSQYAPPPRKPRGGKVLLVVILAVVGLCGMCGIGLVAAVLSGAFGTSHDDLRAMRDRDLGGLPDVRVAREEEGGTASCLPVCAFATTNYDLDSPGGFKIMVEQRLEDAGFRYVPYEEQ